MKTRTLIAASGMLTALLAGLAHADGPNRVTRERNPFVDGAHQRVDPFTDGARKLAGMDRTGVSAEPGHHVDPYLDGAYA